MSEQTVTPTPLHPRWLALLRVVGQLLRCVPPSWAWRLGGGLGALLACLPLRDVRRTRDHLRQAFPEHDDTWIRRTTRRTFVHFGRMTLWTVVTSSADVRWLRRHVAVEGAEHLYDIITASQRGEGTVGFTGHFGNWELLARIGSTIMPLSAVGKRLRSPLADAMVQGLRQAAGGRVIYQDAPFGDFLRELRQGRVLAALVDQDISRLAGCFVPWFGRQAYTPNAPAALARLTRSGVIPIFLFWEHQRWVLHAGPRRYFPRTRDSDGDIRTIVAWITAYEETLVRRAPEQWVWWHKRWRTRPAEETTPPI